MPSMADKNGLSKRCTWVLRKSNNYVKNFFEPSILVGGMPCNELLAQLLVEKSDYENAIKQLDILETKYPNRLSARKLREFIRNKLSD